jgi:hypothetical protein
MGSGRIARGLYSKRIMGRGERIVRRSYITKALGKKSITTMQRYYLGSESGCKFTLIHRSQEQNLEETRFWSNDN